jgi:hypothetical protein
MSISKIFGNQRYSILVDSTCLRDSLIDIEGIENVCLFNAQDNTIETLFDKEIPDNFVFISTKWDSFANFKEIRNKRILLLPQVAFAIDDNTSIYSIQKLLISDFDFAVRKHHEWYPVFSETKQPLCFSGKGSNLMCHLNESIEISTIDDIVLKVDDPRSVAEYFEIALENRIDKASSFSVDGYLDIQGVLIAKGINFRLKNYNDYFANNLIELVNKSSNMKIFVGNNKLTSVLINNVEYLSDFIDLVSEDKAQLPNVTEFAIGFNYQLQNDIDWKFNLQVNEGVKRIHLGIGNGEVGFHLDFITSNIEYSSHLC